MLSLQSLQITPDILKNRAGGPARAIAPDSGIRTRAWAHHHRRRHQTYRRQSQYVKTTFPQSG